MELRIKIIDEDADVLVVYKPQGLATQSGKIGQSDVVAELKNYLHRSGGDTYIGVVHRLDQPVEGLLVFAKNKKAAGSLSAQLKEGVLNKQYYAIVHGNPLEKEGNLTNYMLKSSDNRAEIVDKGSNANAKEARLHYRIVRKTDEKRSLFLADIILDTGRFHQIRAQMAHAGLPLIGDFKYGTAQSIALSKEGNISGVALCAYHLEFVHPTTRKRMTYTVQPQGKAFEMDT